MKNITKSKSTTKIEIKKNNNNKNQNKSINLKTNEKANNNDIKKTKIKSVSQNLFIYYNSYLLKRNVLLKLI